jgi:hypothetical protein
MRLGYLREGTAKDCTQHIYCTIATIFTEHYNKESPTKYRHKKELNVSNIILEIEGYR